MQESSKAVEETSQLEKTDKSKAFAQTLPFALSFAAGCFALAFAAAIAQNTRKPVQELACLFDSGAYLMSASYVLTAARHFFNGMPLETAVKSVAETLMLNGPVLPGLGSIYFSLIGREPSLVDMRAPIVLQAILHATAAALLALAGWRFTGGRIIGLCAGIILAIWPAAIVGASRFLTETITTLFISASILSASYIPQERKDSQLLLSPMPAFIFGCTSALLLLTKAALAPGTLVAIASVYLLLLVSKIEKHSFITAAVTTMLGFCVVFTPWLTFTKIATGELALTARRLPTFNMAAGLNPETDGLSALPETPMVKMFTEDDGPTAVAYALYSLNQGDFYGRMARKPLRLFQYPWNDCRFDLLGLPLAAQIISHQFLVVFGFFGLIAFVSLPFTLGWRFSTAPKQAAPVQPTSDSFGAKQPHPELVPAGTMNNSPAPEINLAKTEPQVLSVLVTGVACVAIILGHLAYLPFVADSRYGFTAIPCLILLATWCFSGLLKLAIKQAAIVRLCIAASFVVLAFSLKDDVWRSLFATSSEAIFASSLTLGALLLFIGCLMAVRTLLGTGKYNASAKVLAFIVTYILSTLVLAASLISKENAYDWEVRLTGKEEACRIIDLPKLSSLPTSAMVLVNLKGDWRAAHLKVNDQPVASAPISLLQLTGNSTLCDDYRTFGYILHSDTGTLDQWRAFMVPPSVLKPDAQNTISLSADQNHSAISLTGSTTFGDNRKELGTVSAPSLRLFSPTNLFRNPLSKEPRLRERMPKSVVHAVSVRKYEGKADNDLSGTQGTQYGQYHMFLLVGHNEAPDLSSKKTDVGIKPIYIEVKSAPVREKKQRKELSHFLYEGFCALPETAFSFPFVRFKLTGDAECSGALDANLHLGDLRLLQAPVELPIFPPRIEGSGKRSFSLDSIAMSRTIDPKSAQVMIKISSDHVPLAVSNLRLEVEPLTAPALTISGKRWY